MRRLDGIQAGRPRGARDSAGTGNFRNIPREISLCTHTWRTTLIRTVAHYR